MVGDTHFLRYLPEPHDSTLVPPEDIKLHILCTGELKYHETFFFWGETPDSTSLTGQVYFTLTQAREERGLKDVAISRIEQLSPFPYDLITPHLDKYPNANLVWCQEEPLNNGAWSYVGPRIYTASGQTEHHKGKYPIYAGRDPTSSVATGSKVRSFFLLLSS